MTARRVVPSLDPGKYLQPGARLGFPLAPCDELTLQRGKEALSHGVVVSITDRAHGGAHIHLLAPVAKGYAGVLAALIAVMDHALGFAGVSGCVNVRKFGGVLCKWLPKSKGACRPLCFY